MLGRPGLRGFFLRASEVLYLCLAASLIFAKYTFRYTYHVTTCLPLAVGDMLDNGLGVLGESDGRCVRASGPSSEKHSTFLLLLNPPLKMRFSIVFVFLVGVECSPFLPFSYATPRPDVLGCTNFAYYKTFIG